jgi:hypothetical protein
VLRPHAGATVVLLRRGVEVACWPLPGSDRPDLALVDELARLQLAARRAGYSIRLRDAPAALSGLLDLLGLAGVLAAGLRLEVGREAEGGEQVGVEEAVQPDDPVA